MTRLQLFIFFLRLVLAGRKNGETQQKKSAVGKKITMTWKRIVTANTSLLMVKRWSTIYKKKDLIESVNSNYIVEQYQTALKEFM